MLLHSFPAFPIISSPEKIKFLDTMSKLKGTWCLVCGAEGWIYINGDVVNDEFLSHALLDALKVSGDVCENLILHYSILCKKPIPYIL